MDNKVKLQYEIDINIVITMSYNSSTLSIVLHDSQRKIHDNQALPTLSAHKSNEHQQAFTIEKELTR